MWCKWAMKKHETHSWGSRGSSLFVVSACNCLDAASSRGASRLIAGTWGHSKEGQLDTCPVSTFFLRSISWHLWSGPVWPFIPREWYGQWCWSIDTFELVRKGENIPSSSTQCLLPDPVPADCDRFREVGGAPEGGVDGEPWPQTLYWRP